MENMKNYDPLTDDQYSPFAEGSVGEALNNLLEPQLAEYTRLCVEAEYASEEVHRHPLALAAMQAKCHEYLMKCIKDYWIETKKRGEQ